MKSICNQGGHQVVGASLEHESAAQHVTGRAIYTDDIPEVQGTLHAAIGLSNKAHAVVKAMDLEAVKRYAGVRAVFTAADIPGSNRFGIIAHDETLLAEVRVLYWGQPLFLVVATSTEIARYATTLAKIDYEDLEPVLCAAHAQGLGQEVAPARHFVKGSPQEVMDAAAHVASGSVVIGGQEHMYLEGQVAYALPQEGRRLLVHTSTQHPTEMQQLVAKMLGWDSARVAVQCRRMGGAFGGKESQSYIFACLAGLAAAKLNLPVRLRVDRDDDFLITGKRHDFNIRWQLAADAEGTILGAQLNHLVRCGWSADYSEAVADRAVLHATNAYYVPHLRCDSYRARTNTQSATAFRGFGGPQGMLGMEVAVESLALQMGVDSLSLRKKNLLGSDERAELPYGFRLQDNVLPELVAQLEQSSDYWRRRSEVNAWNAQHRIVKRGLALMPMVFGVGFGATFLNQASALVHAYADGSVLVNHGGTEMGQGLNTKVSQVVAEVLGLALEQVFCSSTDTSKVPNTVSTAASSGADLNGMAAFNAASTVRERLAGVAAILWSCPVAEVVFRNGRVSYRGANLAFSELCAKAFVAQVPLSATGFYKVPKVGYDYSTLAGRPFLYYVYGAACSEVLVDTLTGETKVERVDLLQDAGRSLNPALDRGQVEGGFIQGAGWMLTEELVWRQNGFLATHAPQTYKIPTSRDIPSVFNIDFFDNLNAEETVFRSKAVGEPPLKLALSVYLAVWDALANAGRRRIAPKLRIPATPEAVLQALTGVIGGL